MKNKVVLTRDNQPTEELSEVKKRTYKGVEVKYTEVFFLDYAVDEETYKIDKTRKDKFYTEEQIERNIKAFKSAYHVAKGAASL